MATETHEFKTELKQMLDIIIHALYSHPEIFLRELISNACDAIDKVRFESLTDADLLEGDDDWQVKVSVDKAAGTLTVSDNGIGLDKDAAMENLGTIARSGTQAFIQRLKEMDAKDRPELIGQFGVGFYASFMVADKVTVVSRMAGEKDKGVCWTSDGKGSFSVEDATREKRGTDITLHLKEDQKEFLEEHRIRQIVKRFSDFVEYPVRMDVERTEKEGETEVVKTETVQLNSGKAIWLRAKNEVTEDEYAEFYKTIAHDFQNPLETIHYSAEGTLEFKALLFLPGQKPMDWMFGNRAMGLQLYVKRVFITDDCEKLLPKYLFFVKGVVDSSDLQLNVSREMLQQDRLLDKIRRNIVGKILNTLCTMRDKKLADYTKFYREFGAVLKNGVAEDFENREKIASLALFESTRTAEADLPITLDQYIEGMQKDQKHIYFLAGEDVDRLRNSPYLEAFKARGEEVLFLTDPVDEIFVQAMPKYKDFEFKGIDRGDFEPEEDKKKHEEQDKEYADLLSFLNEKLDAVKEVRLSSRLTESAACLVVPEGAMSAHMQRLMREMGQSELPPAEKILELNADHEAVKAMQAVFTNDKADARLEDYAQLFYEQAVIAEGGKILDPVGFARRINALLAKDAARS